MLQPTERQRIGDQIDAAMIFAGADFVKKKLYVLMKNQGAMPGAVGPAPVTFSNESLAYAVSASFSDRVYRDVPIIIRRNPYIKIRCSA